MPRVPISVCIYGSYQKCVWATLGVHGFFTQGVFRNQGSSKHRKLNSLKFRIMTKSTSDARHSFCPGSPALAASHLGACKLQVAGPAPRPRRL